MLEQYGHKVIVVGDGLQAVRAATESLPDLILMDLTMPVMDGLDATRALRRLPETRNVPIVVVSAHMGQVEWRTKAFAAGCDECICKPIDYEQLNAVVAATSKFGRVRTFGYPTEFDGANGQRRVNARWSASVFLLHGSHRVLPNSR